MVETPRREAPQKRFALALEASDYVSSPSESDASGAEESGSRGCWSWFVVSVRALALNKKS